VANVWFSDLNQMHPTERIYAAPARKWYASSTAQRGVNPARVEYYQQVLLPTVDVRPVRDVLGGAERVSDIEVIEGSVTRQEIGRSPERTVSRLSVTHYRKLIMRCSLFVRR
jgi:hypothetical protein